MRLSRKSVIGVVSSSFQMSESSRDCLQSARLNMHLHKGDLGPTESPNQGSAPQESPKPQESPPKKPPTQPKTPQPRAPVRRKIEPSKPWPRS